MAAAKRGIDLIVTEEREEQAQRAAQAKARPLADIANEYLDSVKHLRSWCSIESRTRCHIIPKLGNKPVGEVTRADVVDFLDRLERGEGFRHQVNRCRETLRGLLTQLSANWSLQSNCRRVEAQVKLLDRTLRPMN